MENLSGLNPDMDQLVISVINALIKGVMVISPTSGYVTIMYSGISDNGMRTMNTVRLNVNEDTVILDQFGQSLLIQDLEVGMMVAAEFSAVMTRSIPPQSNAYSIIVRPRRIAVVTLTDRVASVDLMNGYLYTGNPYDISDQIRLVITDATIIEDRNGERISLSDISPGQLVRVEHANFQTLSIPPQTTAFLVQVY